MKKILNKKNILIVIIFLFGMLLLSMMFHFFKYSETEWLKHFDNLDGLQKINKFSFWWYISTYELFGAIIFIYPILLILISCYSFFEIYRSGFFQNIILISGYKKTFVFELLKAWKCSLILPLISIISFILSSLFYPNSKILSYVETDGYPFQLVNDFMEVMNPYLFMILYFILLILFGLTVINIGFCFVKIFKKFYLVVISSFVCFVFLENINNLLIAPIVAKLTNIPKMMNGFSLYNLYYLNSSPSFWWEFIFAMLLFSVSTFVVLLIYSKREKVILDYE